MKAFSATVFMAIFFVCSAWAQGPEHYYVRLTTTQGEGILRLSNETPQHRDNFVKLVTEEYYKDLLFHRVIKDFMIQGGDPNSRNPSAERPLGGGGPDYRVPAEFQEHLFHKKGALAAARNDNPEKASSASQFYIVHGRVFTDGGLDSLEQMRLQGRKIPEAHREVYKTTGGVPHLDQNYTVFGELIVGLELVDRIAVVETGQADRPIEDQKMDMTVLNRRETINIERQLQGRRPKNDIFVRFFDLFRPKEVVIK